MKGIFTELLCREFKCYFEAQAESDVQNEPPSLCCKCCPNQVGMEVVLPVAFPFLCNLILLGKTGTTEPLLALGSW